MAESTSIEPRRCGERGAGELTRLVRQGLAYVPSVARRYVGSGPDLDELIAAGNLGLVEAALRFDPSRRVSFLTYADWWVRKTIIEAMEALSGPVRFPRYRYELLRRIKQAEVRWMAMHGARPTAGDLARITGIDVKRIERLRSTEPRGISLDHPRHAGDGPPLSESFDDPLSDCPQSSAIRGDLGIRLRRQLAVLDPRERQVIRLRFGLDGDPPLTLRQAARIVGLSRERVRQIELGALVEIRRVL